MYISTGYDNFELRLAITEDERRGLKSLCLYKDKEARQHILLGDRKDPTIILKFKPGRVYANFNAPKLIDGHNIGLAGPEHVAAALRIVTDLTSRAAPRLRWSESDVVSLHIASCFEVEDFERYADLCRAPHGFEVNTQYAPNLYHNSSQKNIQMICYDKAQQLRDTGRQLPIPITLEMASPQYALFRFEVRINQSVCAQLRLHGGWSGSFLLADDLRGPAFGAALKYLQRKFQTHIPIPVTRQPILDKNPSARAYALHNNRETAYENPDRMRERAITDYAQGAISKTVMDSEIARAGILSKRQRAIYLHEILATNCKKLIEVRS